MNPVLAARGPPGEATEAPYADVESLPSYTIVSGLPSYEEALRQLRLARERRESLKSASDLAAPPPASPIATAAPASPLAAPPLASATATANATANGAAPGGIKLSVAEFFQVYKTYPPM